MMYNKDNFIWRRRGLKEGRMRIKRRRKIRKGEVGRERKIVIERKETDDLGLRSYKPVPTP
jgi:hypothetical protein